MQIANLNRLRVLQLGKFFPIEGGIEKVMYDLMIGLSARGIFCDMLCASAGTHPGGVFRINEFATLLIAKTKRSLASTKLAPGMVTELKKIAHQYDIIHIHHPDPMACVALYFSGFTGKVVLHWHSDIIAQKVLLKFYRPFQKWLKRRADIIVGTTPAYVEASTFLDLYGQKTDFIPIGIDPLMPDEAKALKLRRSWGAEGKTVVFSLGRLVEYKGFDYLIKAAKYLSDDYLIVIAGKGPLYNKLTTMVKSYELSTRVKIVGYIDDVDRAAYFTACDVFCLSSIYKNEAFGIVQLEAMSMSKPVICTHIPESGTDWVNKNGVSGLVCDPNSPVGLSDAIRDIGESQELKDRLGEGARKRYLKHFTKELMVAKCVEVYYRVSGQVSSGRINTEILDYKKD